MSTWVACLIAMGDESSTTRKALSSLVCLPFSFALLETNETLIILQCDYVRLQGHRIHS
jgi:hypothetical protein